MKGQKSVFCEINSCGFDVLKRFCGYNKNDLFDALHIDIFFQIELTIEK